MNKLDDYYQKILNDILTNVHEQKYEQALELIDLELQQPYIPNQYYSDLLNTREDVLLKINEKQYENHVNNLSKLQIWHKIYNQKNNKIDLVYLNLFFSKYETKLESSDYAIMQDIFLNKQLPNDQKTILVATLIDYQIDKNFEYYNILTKDTSSFNPLYTNGNNHQSVAIYESLEQVFLKDPSKLEIANNLLHMVMIDFFPQSLPYDNDLISNSIVNVVNSLFDDEKIMDNEITNLLKVYIN